MAARASRRRILNTRKSKKVQPLIWFIFLLQLSCTPPFYINCRCNT
jgi:hypothetical protein